MSEPDEAGSAESESPEEPGHSPTDTLDTSPSSNAPLMVENLEKHFGGITAIDGASFSVEEGSMTGLIGPNGAGKSTTFNCITGFHQPDGGRVLFNGEDITGRPPYEIATRGLVRTFQIARELEEMTVLENLMLGPPNQRGEKLLHAVLPGLRDQVRAEETELREKVWEILEFFEIDHLAEAEAGTLSGGQRKLLELARALMVNPDMALLDEPFAGVNPTLEAKLLDRIHALRNEGLTFLLVEHDMDVIMDNCDHIIVMHQGTVIAEGDAEAIRRNETVIDAYLGADT